MNILPHKTITLSHVYIINVNYLNVHINLVRIQGLEPCLHTPKACVQPVTLYSDMAGSPGLEPETTVLETDMIAISPRPYNVVELEGTAPSSKLAMQAVKSLMLAPHNQ